MSDYVVEYWETNLGSWGYTFYYMSKPYGTRGGFPSLDYAQSYFEGLKVLLGNPEIQIVVRESNGDSSFIVTNVKYNKP